MNDSLYELACRLVDLASAEGPVDDVFHDLGEKFTELAHQLHDEESPEQDEEIEKAVGKLIEAFQAPNVERAGFSAAICGSLCDWQTVKGNPLLGCATIVASNVPFTSWPNHNLGWRHEGREPLAQHRHIRSMSAGCQSPYRVLPTWMPEQPP